MNASSQKPRQWWVSWLIKAGGSLIVLIALLIVTAPYSIGWIIGHTLQSQLSTRMQAKLEFSRVLYKFPYGVRVEKAHLLMPSAASGPDSWVDIGRLELKLAKLPIGIGPLLIERLDIENPTVRLASSFGDDSKPKPAAADTNTPSEKLSDLFKLQSVTMTGGRFEYDLSAKGRQLPPVIWDHLDAQINTRPTDVSNYQFALSLDDKPLATVKATGAFDIDSLILELEHLNVEAACDSKQQAEQLPPLVQEAIQRYEIAGQIAFDAKAHVPLKTLDQTSFDATLTLKNGQCKPPGWTALIKPAQSVFKCANHGDRYDFKLTANDGTTAAFSSAGSFYARTMLLDVPEFEVMAQCDSPQLPPQAVQLVQKYQATGQLTLKGSALLPVQSPADAQCHSVLTLENARFRPPGFAGPITPTEFSFETSTKAGACQFKLNARDKALAALQATGSLDLKSKLLNLDQVDLTLQSDADHPSNQLPQKAADIVAKNKIGGEITINGSARVPLDSPQRLVYAGHLSLKNGRCQPQDWNGPITPAVLAFSCSNAAGATANSLPNKIPLDLPVQPALSHLWLDGVSADCGKQSLKIEDGCEVIFNPNDKTWEIHKLHGVADFGNGPGPLDGANLCVWVPFIASGNGTLGDDKSAVRIALDGGAARVTPSHILIDQINGMLTATPVGLTSTGLTALCAQGQLKLGVNLNWKPPTDGVPTAMTYHGEINVSKLDLHQLAMQYTEDPAIRQQAFGELDLNTKYQGTLLAGGPQSGPNSAADLMTAQGDLDINHGYFLDLPILKDVLIAMNNPNASTLGEVAATYDIAHQVVNFSQVAVSSPVLGVQGSGTLGFDQTLNMNFVATPLSDWSKDLKGTGVSFLSGLSDIAGKAQTLVNKAQSVALYQFRVTGKASKPDVKAVPVPALTDQMGPLFEKMSGNHAEGSMSEELKKQNSTTQPTN